MSHAPFLEQIDTEKIMVAWFAGSQEWAKDVHILVSDYSLTTLEEGNITTLVTETNYSLGNSILAKDSMNKLHLWYVRTRTNWHEGEIIHMLSHDSGKNWSSSEAIPLPRGWLIRGRPFLSGSKVYLPVYDERNATSAIWTQDCTIKRGTLSEIISGPGGLIHPVLVPIQGDEFRCFFRNPWSPNRIYYAFSLDRGKTWSRPGPTDLPNPNSGIDVVRLPNDLLVCAYNDSESKRYPLSIAVSKNLGRDWEKVLDIEDEHKEFSYPSFLQTKDHLHLAYSYQRKGIKIVTFEKTEFLQ